MVSLEPIHLDDFVVLGVKVSLPKTTLLAIATNKGYIMCGALDVQLLNDKLRDRQIIAARATGVRSLNDLLDAPLESVTIEAEQLGIVKGMKGRDALRLMLV